MTDLENRVSELEYQVAMLNNLIMPFVESAVAVTQGSKKEKEKEKRTKKEKEKERSNTTLFSKKLDQQIGTTDRGKEDKREQIKAILPDLEQRKVKCVTIDRWLDTYEPQFIVEEISMALNWLSTRSHPKKDHGRFFNNWLTRAYQRQRNEHTGQAAASELGSNAEIDKYFN
jgi:hypothetical protein